VTSPASLTRTDKRLLILWFALAFVVWNGVYDMRMHDTVRGYLLETALAPPGRGVDMRAYLHRGRVDAIAFSTAWALGVFLAGMVTMKVLRRPPSTEHQAPEHPSTEH
jgi:hypothetical protein